MSDTFDWSSDECVQVRTQMAISVYLNTHGELVIRQEGRYHPDEDVWIVISPENVPKVIVAMDGAIGLTAVAGGDPTAAARQRNFRKRRRERDTVTPITGDGAVTDRNAKPSRQTDPLQVAAE